MAPYNGISEGYKYMTHEDSLTVKKSQSKRLYMVEFLRIFFISGIIFAHIGKQINTNLLKDLHQLFGATSNLGFGVEGFFIISGFFLYKSIIKRRGSAFEHIQKLWMRLLPALLFAFAILLCLGSCSWWKVVDLLFFIPGTGLAREVIWNSEWFVCVYFLVSCLWIGLFNYSEKFAWVLVGVLAYFSLSLQIHAHPVRYSNSVDQVYYTLITTGICRGIACMSLGMIASYVSGHILLSRGCLFRIVASCFEIAAFYLLFNHMFRTSSFRFSIYEAELVLTLLMISTALSWGYISAAFNRMSWIQNFSRYSYPFLVGHAVMLTCVKQSSFSCFSAYNKSIMVVGGGILLGVIEYHLVEKYLVPKIRAYLSRDQGVEIEGEANS